MAELEPTSPTTATCANSLTRDQVANLADEIATDAHSIKRLALMLDASSDLRDRSAIATSIEALASRAGSLADMLNTGHGGVAVLGGVADWFNPASLPD